MAEITPEYNAKIIAEFRASKGACWWHVGGNAAVVAPPHRARSRV
jgi:hypothetical protein